MYTLRPVVNSKADLSQCRKGGAAGRQCFGLPGNMGDAGNQGISDAGNDIGLPDLKMSGHFFCTGAWYILCGNLCRYIRCRTFAVIVFFRYVIPDKQLIVCLRPLFSAREKTGYGLCVFGL